jgi:hypothetical protein
MDLNRVEQTPLTAAQLHQKQKKRTTIRTKIFKALYHKCEQRIKLQNEMNRKECHYTIPYFTLGLPSFPMEEAREYFMKRLTACGFISKKKKSNIIFISWRNPLVKSCKDTSVHNNHHVSDVQDIVDMSSIQKRLDRICSKHNP